MIITPLLWFHFPSPWSISAFFYLTNLVVSHCQYTRFDPLPSSSRRKSKCQQADAHSFTNEALPVLVWSRSLTQNQFFSVGTPTALALSQEKCWLRVKNRLFQRLEEGFWRPNRPAKTLRPPCLKKTQTQRSSQWSLLKEIMKENMDVKLKQQWKNMSSLLLILSPF